MKRSDYPLVSIVLLNFNGLEFVNQWRPLFELDYPRYEIIFVDNGSNDVSENAFFKLANEYGHINVEMLKLQENFGYSKANNFGVQETRGKYIVLLSNDIKVTRGWLKNAIRVLESDKRIGVAQSMMYMLDDPSKPDKMGNYVDVFGFNHGFSFSGNLKEVFYCEGAVMFIPRNVIDEAGGLFDSSYFMFYEDIDFCWRVRLLGYKAVVLPKSIVYHKRGGTVSGTLIKIDPLYVFTNTRNRLNTMLKNYSTWNLFKFVPTSVAIEILKAFLLILNGKTKAGQACFRGVYSFVFGFRNTIPKRLIVQKRRKVGDEQIMKLMTPKGKAFHSILNSAQKLRNEWKKG